MSSLAYYLTWLGAALLVIAALSAWVTRHLRRGQRRLQAVALLDALERSSDWAAAQARAVCFQAATQHTDPALDVIRTVQRQWFRELDSPAAALFAVHGRLGTLLRMHDRLRAEDPEAWLDAACDAAVIALQREHDSIVQEMERRLLAAAGPAGTPHRHASAA